MTVHIYIDAANLHKSSRRLGFEIDYRKFYMWIRQKYEADRVYMFFGFIDKYVNLYSRLREHGYILMFKETIVTIDGEVKGNCDAELVLKVVSDYYEKNFDTCVLLSGDGDFSCVVSFLAKKGALHALVVPSEARCSALLKRAWQSIAPLDKHYAKFSRKISNLDQK